MKKNIRVTDETYLELTEMKDGRSYSYIIQNMIDHIKTCAEEVKTHERHR